MLPSEFSPEELYAVRCICAPFRLRVYTPGYLQGYIARQLAGAGRQDAAARVRALDAGGMGALADHVRDAQGQACS